MAAKGSKKIDQYRELFTKFDTNGSGTLSISELRDMLKSGGSHMSDREIADTFVFFDGPKGDKKITFEEFTKGLDAMEVSVEKLRDLFIEMDTSKNGFLDRDELRVLLQRSGREFNDAELTSFWEIVDKNGDNKIGLEEFVDACC